MTEEMRKSSFAQADIHEKDLIDNGKWSLTVFT